MSIHLAGNKQADVHYDVFAGGLTENDFIMAAKINMIEAADLMPKKKKQYWA